MKARLFDSTEWRKILPYLENLDPVVIPTETVYGLGALADSDEACKKIFSIKNRPADNPLIVHCSDQNMAKSYMAVDSKEQQAAADLACTIFEHFSPGPISCIVHANSRACETARAGTDTVALRIPNHDLLLRIIKQCNVALAAPSANLSGQPSPTNTLMVWDYMAKKVPAILDGGFCRIGLESTIVDCRDSSKIQIVRPGFISARDLAEKTGLVVEDPFSPESGQVTKMHHEDLLVPGLKYPHYAPKASVSPVVFEKENNIFRIKSLEHRARDLPELVAVLSAAARKASVDDRKTSLKENPLSVAGVIFGPVDRKDHSELQEKLVEEGWQMVRVFKSWQSLEQILFACFSESDCYELSDLYVSCPQAHVSSALHNRINKAAGTY